MKRKVSLVLNTDKPDEMSNRFQALFEAIDQPVRLAHVNLGSGFSREIPSDTDEILFTGGIREKLSTNPEMATEIQRLFQATGEPIMGVCFGAQVIARQYGVRLIKLPEKRFGDHTITIVASGDPYLMPHFGDNNVHESHLFTMPVEVFPDELQVLGQSSDGVEVFAHDRLPQGGVQFHPERGIGSNNGAEIFDALRKTVLDKRSKK